MNSFSTLANEFTFDWNDYKTIALASENIDNIEKKFADQKSYVDRIMTDSPESAESFALYCYRLGTYYNHVKRNPDLALEKLLLAKEYLTFYLKQASKNLEQVYYQLAWINNHIAFSYLQLFLKNKSEENINMVLSLCNDIINEFYPAKMKDTDIVKVQLTGFAYCLKALAEYEMKQIHAGIYNYEIALNLYEKANLKDDQYARAKNRYAQFLCERGDVIEAGKIFNELEIYWTNKEDNLNPYLARFYKSYAEYYQTQNDIQNALIRFNKAYEILLATEGEQSRFVKEIAEKIELLSAIQETPSKKIYGETPSTLYHYNPLMHAEKTSPSIQTKFERK